MNIVINGEEITADEAMALLKMLYHDAKQIAGEYYDMDRSEKFRINWPDQYKYADANWKTFVVDTRKMYAALLSDPKTPPEKAKRISQVLILERMVAEGQETDNRLQLSRNTQQFVGDRYENRKIMERFGKKPNLRAALMNSVATRH